MTGLRDIRLRSYLSEGVSELRKEKEKKNRIQEFERRVVVVTAKMHNYAKCMHSR